MTFDEALEAVAVFRDRVTSGAVVHPSIYRAWMDELRLALTTARTEHDALQKRVGDAEAVLHTIANQDYRGNEPVEQVQARRYFAAHTSEGGR